MYGQWRGDLVRAAKPSYCGAEDLEKSSCLSRSSGRRQAVRKVRAIPTARRLQDG
jgi:hypothetical protein